MVTGTGWTLYYFGGDMSSKASEIKIIKTYLSCYDEKNYVDTKKEMHHP